MAISGLDGLGPPTQDRTTEFIRRTPEPPRATPIAPEPDQSNAIDRRAKAARETSEADTEREQRRRREEEEVESEPAVSTEDIALDVARNEENLARLREANSVHTARQSLLDG
jgi:hypothetical protein